MEGRQHGDFKLESVGCWWDKGDVMGVRILGDCYAIGLRYEGEWLAAKCEIQYRKLETHDIIFDAVYVGVQQAELRSVLKPRQHIIGIRKVVFNIVHFQNANFLESPCSELFSKIAVDSLDRFAGAGALLNRGVKPLVREHVKGA